MKRQRYQRGQIYLDPDPGGDRRRDRWCGRWREDQVLPRGTPLRKGDTLLPSGEVLHRTRRWDVLAPREGVTREMAQKILDARMRGDDETQAAAPALQWLDNLGVKLCGSCRQRFVDALRTGKATAGSQTSGRV